MELKGKLVIVSNLSKKQWFAMFLEFYSVLDLQLPNQILKGYLIGILISFLIGGACIYCELLSTKWAKNYFNFIIWSTNSEVMAKDHHVTCTNWKIVPIQFKSKMNKFLWASEVNQLSQNHYTSLADKKQTKQFITPT